MGKNHPAHALTAQQTAPNQDARKLVIFTAAFILLVLLAFSLTLRAKEFGKKQPAHARTAQNAAADQEAHKTAIFTTASASLLFISLVLAFVLAAFFLAPLAKEMSKQHSTHALTTQNAAANQEAHKTAIFTTASLVFIALVLAFFLALLTKKMGK